MEDDPRQTVSRLATLAGIEMPPERIAALALSLPFVRAEIATLAGTDYREAEPAGRFRPRPEPSP